MRLRRAKHNRLLALVYLLHEQLDAIALPLLDLDGAVELRLLVALAFLDLAFRPSPLHPAFPVLRLQREIRLHRVSNSLTLRIRRLTNDARRDADR